MRQIKIKLIKSLKSIFKPLADRLGFVEMNGFNPETNKNHLILQAFSTFKSNGFYPKSILDIGANHGTWTRETLKIFPDAKYFLIEPQAWLENSIKDLKSSHKVSFYPIGVGKLNCVLDFSINTSDDSSSFKPMESKIKGYEFYKSISVQMKTVDSFLKEENLNIPDLVKIDAEGLDLDVLEGAQSIFGVTELILVEASIHQKEFPNSLLKVMNFMNEKDYELFDFTDLNRPFSSGLLWLVEVLFVKKNSQFVK